MATSQASTNTELHELATKMQSGTPQERVDAIGRLVAMDAQGADCSSVYPMIYTAPDLTQPTYIKARRFVNIMTEIYLPTNAGLNPTAIQTIISDFERTEPLIKGIAVREAGRIATEATVDRLLPMILRGATNEDPYVRKAAALAILNLFHTRASFIEKYKLGATLKTLVEDSNPNVAANAVSALAEINAAASSPLFVPTSQTVNNLLAAIDQTTEWAQVQILDFVCTYKPADGSDARGIIARVSSRLSHANSAVALSAIRCCLQMNLFVDDQAKVRDTLTKVVLPLVTLLNNSAPIQYVAVKSILVLLQHYKRMLSSEVSIFFCKFDDPLYMKLAKLDVILSLANTQNVGKVLEELYDYAQQTDVTFVRKSIAAIGRITVQFESAAQSCVDKLVALMQMKVHFVVQECVVVAADIFRRYPGKYEGIISTICASLTGNLDDHRAKSAMVWILGEYASMISNAADLLDALFLDDFVEDTPDVQLAILSTVVKYYLVNPDQGQEMLQRVITMATNELDNPDVRDRAYMYYWLLTEATDAAQDIVIPSEAPKLTVDPFTMDPALAEKLVPMIGTIAILYNKMPSDFVQRAQIVNVGGIAGDDAGDNLMKAGETSIDKMELPVLVDSQTGAGLEVKGVLMRIGDANSFVLRFTNFNEANAEISDIAFNRNIFGFAPGTTDFPKTVGYQQSLTVNVPVVFHEQHMEGAKPSVNIDIAVQLNRPQPVIFQCPARLDMIFVGADAGGKLSKKEFLSTWQGIEESCEVSANLDGARIDNLEVAKHKLQQNRLFFTAKKDNCAYFSAKTIKGEVLIAYIVFVENAKIQVGIRMWNKQVSPVLLELLGQLLK